jgi:sugar lactone lactonase YvrE
MTSRVLRVGVGAIALTAVVIIDSCISRSDTDDSSTSKPAARAGPLASVSGLKSSEAVVFDPARDVYFVSNINGEPGVKDGNGFITRITANGVVDSLHFIQGGRNGVTLNAPMGSRIQGDTLWVLDVDVLRGFDARTGKPTAAINLAPAGAGFLNDLTAGPDGDFYITDTGVRFAKGKLDHTAPDRIYHVDRNRRVTVALESPALSLPDGIGWDPRDRKLILAPFGGNAVQEWHPGDPAPTNIAPGPSKFDGVEVESDGTIIVTIWNDSSVSILDVPNLVKKVVLNMPPADASVDLRRQRVGVVSVDTDRFELWPWPAAKP